MQTNTEAKHIGEIVNPHIYSKAKTYYRHANKYLTAEQVNSIFDACERAYKAGYPLNRFFTIHYDDCADPKRPQAFIVSILEKTRKWLQYRGLPVAYTYVIENGKYKGIHVHLLLHIPAHHQIEYKRALRGWLPFEWTHTRVKVKTIKYPTFGNLSPLDGVYGVLRYMCKALDPNTPTLGIEPSYQGKIYGRRWGISVNLR